MRYFQREIMERNSQPENFLLHMVHKFPGMCNPTGSAICIDSAQAEAGGSSSLLAEPLILFSCKCTQTKGKALLCPSSQPLTHVRGSLHGMSLFWVMSSPHKPPKGDEENRLIGREPTDAITVDVRDYVERKVTLTSY